MKIEKLSDLITLRNHAITLLNGARADLKLTDKQKSQLVKAIRKADNVFLDVFSEDFIESEQKEVSMRFVSSTHDLSDVLDAALKADSAVNTEKSTAEADKNDQLHLFDKEPVGKTDPVEETKKAKKRGFTKSV